MPPPQNSVSSSSSGCSPAPRASSWAADSVYATTASCKKHGHHVSQSHAACCPLRHGQSHVVHGRELVAIDKFVGQKVGGPACRAASPTRRRSIGPMCYLRKEETVQSFSMFFGNLFSETASGTTRESWPTSARRGIWWLTRRGIWWLARRGIWWQRHQHHQRHQAAAIASSRRPT